MTKDSLYLLHLTRSGQHPFLYPTSCHSYTFLARLCICLTAMVWLTTNFRFLRYGIFFFNLPIWIQYRIVPSLTPIFLAIELTLLPSFNCFCTRSNTCGSILWLLPFLPSGAKNAASPFWRYCLQLRLTLSTETCKVLTTSL